MRKFLAAYAARNRSGKIYKHDSEHVARFLDPMAREVLASTGRPWLASRVQPAQLAR